MTPTVTVRFWAGARRAAGRESDQLAAATLRDLVAQLSAEPALSRVCAASSYLVDGQHASEDAELTEGAVVDVLPPFAGG